MSLYQFFDSAREQITKTGASMFSEFTASPETEIPKLLNSSSQLEVNQGLRTLLTMVAEGRDVHGFFGYVVKNVHSNNTRTREMAAALLIMYSQHEPELTLLIVNSVKRMLDDPSPLMRMQALHLVSALRVPTIAPIITHFIMEALNDPSAVVRIACCQAIGKCYELDSALNDDMLGLLTDMLNSPKQIQSNTREAHRVAGWALAVLAMYWPQRIDVLHPFFRVYISHMSDFDDFCVVTVGEMLLRYCRHYLTGPEDPDARMVIDAVQPLLNSINSSVAVQAAAIVHYVGKPSDFEELKVAVRLLSLPPSVLTWENILMMCAARPQHFAKCRSRIIFGLTPETPPSIRVAAAKCIYLIGVESNNPKEGVSNENTLTNSMADSSEPTTTATLSHAEYSHLQFCVECWQDHQESVRATLQAITGLTSRKSASKVLRWLVSCTTNTNNDPIFVSESLMALRVFLQQQQHLSDVSHVIAKLATSDTILASAKATLVWMLSTHATTQPALCTELLRQLLITMANESTEVRLQILQLAAKLMTAYKNDTTAFDPRVPQFFDYAIKIAHYDQEVDVRDRARLFANIIHNGSEENSMANLLLQVQLPAPKSHEIGVTNIALNSASAHFHKRMGTYALIEGWSKEDTSKLRERADTEHVTTASAVTHSTPTAAARPNYRAPKIQNMSLEDFLKQEDESKGDESSSSNEPMGSEDGEEGAEDSGEGSDEESSEEESGESSEES